MIETSDSGGVTVITLAHGKVNAMDLEFLEALRDTFRELAGTDCASVVVTGTGRAFSAGVELRRFSDGGAAYAEAFLPALNEMFEAVFNFERPVVAAVNGHAVAGGCVLAAACDRRIMAAGTGRIGVTELHAGLPFPLTALEIFRFLVGPARANDLILTARTCDPAEALAVGLVDEVVPADELMARAASVAGEMAAFIPPATFRINKAQMRRETNERVARHRVDNDPEVLAAWSAPEVGPWAKAFVDRVSGRG